MAGQSKHVSSLASRLMPAEPTLRTSRTVSARVCSTVRGESPSTRASVTRARFSDWKSGARCGRRYNSSVIRIDSSDTEIEGLACESGSTALCARATSVCRQGAVIGPSNLDTKSPLLNALLGGNSIHKACSGDAEFCGVCARFACKGPGWHRNRGCGSGLLSPRAAAHRRCLGRNLR